MKSAVRNLYRAHFASLEQTRRQACRTDEDECVRTAVTHAHTHHTVAAHSCCTQLLHTVAACRCCDAATVVAGFFLLVNKV